MLTIDAPAAPAALDPELARWLERSEALAFASAFAGAAETDGNPTGASHLEVGGGVAAALAATEMGLFNRAMGFGFDEPLTESIVDEVARFFSERARPQSTIQLAPSVATPDAEAWLARRGYQPGRRWVKLWHDLGTMPVARTSLRVERIDETLADDFLAIALAVFGLPEAMDPFLRGSIGRPGWTHYLAFDGERPVSTAATFVGEEVAWLAFGATLEDARGRGGQSALFAARLRDAWDLGCRWAVTETGEETDEFPVNHSYRNMLRSGFRFAYARRNYNRDVAAG